MTGSESKNMADGAEKSKARQRFALLQERASQLGLNNNDILNLGVIQQHQKPISLTRIVYKTFFILLLVGSVIAGVLYGGRLQFLINII